MSDLKKAEKPKTDDRRYYGDARNWETSRVMIVERSEARAWLVAKVAVFIALLAIIAVALLAPYKSVVPFLVQVDKFGDTRVVPMGDTPMPVSEAQNKHLVHEYVMSRERYFWSFLQYDYDKTVASSEGKAARDYKAIFDGPNARQDKLGSSIEYAIKIVSITLPQPGQARVRFEKEVRTVDSGVAGVVTRHIATLSYSYKPVSVSSSEKILIMNPLGFKVDDYRVDEELVSVAPTSALTPAPTLAPASTDAVEPAVLNNAAPTQAAPSRPLVVQPTETPKGK